MIRRFSLIAVAAGFLLAPIAAQALGVSIVNVSSSGASTSVLRPGDTLTVDLAVENAGGAGVFASSVGVRGYDPDVNGIADSGLNVTGGILPTSLFNVAESGGVGIGGLFNQLSAPSLRGDPGVPVNPTSPFYVPPTELHAVFYDGLDTSAHPGDGSLDNGIFGGLTGVTGEAHIRMVFTASVTGQVAPTHLTLDFGNHIDLGTASVGNGGSVIPFTNTSLNVTIVPEPGTALLMGLGLAGLALRRR